MKRSVKILSFVLSVCMIISVLGICASAEETAQSRALLLGAAGGDAFITNDIAAMKEMYESNGIKTTEYVNRAANTEALQKAISDFASQSESTYNYVFITSHGGDNEINLNGPTKSGIPYSELRTMLDSIKGKIILMIDACYAGSSISKDKTIEQYIIEAFSDSTENQNLNSVSTYGNSFDSKTKYIVFCSSFSNETSNAFEYGSSFGTIAWSTGLKKSSQSYAADTTGDKTVTAKELNDYAINYINENFKGIQTPCYYADPYFQTVLESDYSIGDINQDGSINMKDDLVLKKYIAGSVTLTEKQVQLADLNQDGFVNMKDELVLRKYIAGQSITE